MFFYQLEKWFTLFPIFCNLDIICEKSFRRPKYAKMKSALKNYWFGFGQLGNDKPCYYVEIFKKLALRKNMKKVFREK